MPETLSLTLIDEEYFTISSTSVTSLSREGNSKTLSTRTVPQPCVSGHFSSSLPARETHDSDNEWEDLEDLEKEEREEKEDCTRVCDRHQIINRLNITREKKQCLTYSILKY